MSRAELSRLMGDVRETPRLLKELKDRVHDAEAAISWASGQGYDLDPRDVEDLRDSDQELCDDELDKVAGGDDAWSPTGGGTPPPPSGGG
jgi:predicted ribosomally synthesized peptide with nif11-like leader